MAIKHIRADKLSPVRPVITLIRGDASSQIIRLAVNRYYGGVDLAPLAWAVTVENAAGATDTYGLDAQLSSDDIEMEWCVCGTATAAPGVTSFTLSGFSEEENAVLWQSGMYHICVKDAVEYIPGSETEARLSNVQKLLLYVEGNLQNIVRAGEDAAKAAALAANEFKGIVDRLTTAFSETGGMVTCHPVEGYPLNVKTVIEPVQAGMGDASPDNIRRISGAGSATVSRYGENLIENRNTSMPYNGITYTVNDDGSITLDGTAAGDSVYYLNQGTAIAVPAGRYIVCGLPDQVSGSAYISFYDGQDNSGKRIEVHREDEILTLESGYIYNFRIVIRSGAVFSNAVYYPGMFLADRGESFAAGFDATVYGGVMDWATGMLTVNMGVFESYAGESLSGRWISDRDVYTEDGTPSNGAQVVYELTEPVQMQLAPQQIAARRGTNTLWSDVGHTSVSGRIAPEWLNEQFRNAIISMGGNL